MKDALHRRKSDTALGEESRNKRIVAHCSICASRIWFESMHLQEPIGVPEPRLSWVVCKSCYQHVQAEMARSPVKSPLRLRIAMGIVASERSPHAYPTRIRQYVSDRRWILFIAIGFVLAMLFHLSLIVMLPLLKP